MRVFVYMGEEGTEAFGLRFPFNEPVEVTDAHAIKKLSGNRFFTEVVDGVEIASEPAKRKPGRPRKDA
jgi:hypothetical protein